MSDQSPFLPASSHMALLYYDPLFLEHTPSTAHPECPDRLRSIQRRLAVGSCHQRLLPPPRVLPRERVLAVAAEEGAGAGSSPSCERQSSGSR